MRRGRGGAGVVGLGGGWGYAVHWTAWTALEAAVSAWLPGLAGRQASSSRGGKRRSRSRGNHPALGKTNLAGADLARRWSRTITIHGLRGARGEGVEWVRQECAGYRTGGRNRGGGGRALLQHLARCTRLSAPTSSLLPTPELLLQVLGGQKTRGTHCMCAAREEQERHGRRQQPHGRTHDSGGRRAGEEGERMVWAPWERAHNYQPQRAQHDHRRRPLAPLATDPSQGPTPCQVLAAGPNIWRRRNAVWLGGRRRLPLLRPALHARHAGPARGLQAGTLAGGSAATVVWQSA